MNKLELSEISRIRKYMAQSGAMSQTSNAYQNDILSMLDSEGPTVPGDVIEVGCYLGGLTAQLAYACRVLDKRLHVVDVNINYATTALTNLDSLGLCNKVTLFIGTLTDYLLALSGGEGPFLIVIDGDHYYDGVMADIRAATGSLRRPKNLIFHDFSLRYAQPEMHTVRVDRAILDHFGPSHPLEPVGEPAGVSEQRRVIPGHDGHYHEISMPEGVRIRT